LLKQQVEHQKWLEEEGGTEGATHIETLMQPEQQRRIRWLKEHCAGTREILDVGCNFGWILNEIDGKCGVDINRGNIEAARRQFPSRWFRVGDVTKGLDFEDQSMDIVVEADLLEHLKWFRGVEVALAEGLRIARRKLLITLPWRTDEKCALCFKHSWVPDERRVGKILVLLMLQVNKVTTECDGTFIYIKAINKSGKGDSKSQLT